jgi:hypothetical protein
MAYILQVLVWMMSTDTALERLYKVHVTGCHGGRLLTKLSFPLAGRYL